jgi:acyl-coenzyme A thioesterase PaaI-like protein
MDYDAIAKVLEEVTPANRHLGVTYREVGPEQVVCDLADDERLRNHVGSQHAAAIFAVAEAAAGGAFVAAFGPRMAEINFVARAAEIGYTKIARGPLEATARLQLSPDLVLAEVDEKGRTRTAVEVAIADGEGERVAEMRVTYSVRRGDPRTAPKSPPAEAQVN